jgi:hypothetical protein
MTVGSFSNEEGYIRQEFKETTYQASSTNYYGGYMNITITVIDTLQDTAMNNARRTYPDHIPVNSVWSMVDGIIARMGATRTPNGASGPVAIGLLRIVGHGEPGLQAIGNSHDTQNRRQFISLDGHGHLNNREALTRLRGFFAANAVVELHGCQVGGRGFEALRRALKALWGVSVRASAIDQDPVTPQLDYLHH